MEDWRIRGSLLSRSQGKPGNETRAKKTRGGNSNTPSYGEVGGFLKCSGHESIKNQTPEKSKHMYQDLRIES